LAAPPADRGAYTHNAGRAVIARRFIDHYAQGRIRSERLHEDMTEVVLAETAPAR